MQLYWVSLNGYVLSGNMHWMSKYFWLKNLEQRNKYIDVNENVLIQKKLLASINICLQRKPIFIQKKEFYYLDTVIDLRSNWQYIQFSKMAFISVSIACFFLKLYCVKKSNKLKSNSSVFQSQRLCNKPM